MLRVRSVRIRTRFLRSARCRDVSSLIRRRGAAPPAGRGPDRRPDRHARARPARARVGRRRDGERRRCASIRRPQGKTIGRSSSSTRTVFSKRDWYFQLFNIFHRTTRGYILERELLFKPGQPYDQALVEESTRNLQIPAAGRRRAGRWACPSCRASSSSCRSCRRSPGRSICWWSRATSGACASTPTSSTRATR